MGVISWFSLLALLALVFCQHRHSVRARNLSLMYLEFVWLGGLCHNSSIYSRNNTTNSKNNNSNNSNNHAAGRRQI